MGSEEQEGIQQSTGQTSQPKATVIEEEVLKRRCKDPRNVLICHLNKKFTEKI